MEISEYFFALAQSCAAAIIAVVCGWIAYDAFFRDWDIRK
jgi:hypothetical protein